MGVRAVWSVETADMLTAATGSPQDRQFLVVERLPDGGWDWITWNGSAFGRACHGVAESPFSAMQAAESAAATLHAFNLFFSVG